MTASPPPGLRARLTFRALDAEGADCGGFGVRVGWSPAPLEGAWDVHLKVAAAAARECGLRVALDLEAPPRAFMVPACLYPEAAPGSTARQPRWAPEPSEDPLAASEWAFGADRASHPAVFAWSAGAFTAIAAAEADGRLGMTGLGLGGSSSGGRIWLDFPAREAPVSFDGRAATRPWTSVHSWRAGEEADLRLTVYEAPPEPHAYDPLLRLLYWRAAAANRLAPWVDVEAAAAIAAEGLCRHHLVGHQRVIAETRGFEPGFGDRQEMHAGWLSGAPVAAALRAHALRTGDELALAAAESVLDHLVEGTSPCGLPWTLWSPDSGWRSSWTRPGTLHSRTAAEAALFLARAGRRADRALDTVELAQRPDGALPALFDAVTGEGLEWEGSAGLAWVAPLAEAGRVPAAARAGEFYAAAVDSGRLAGAPEDVHLASTSEDGYLAIAAYAALHRATGEERWLQLARVAAGWTMTFRWAHNIRWPRHTLLDRYQFLTRGADAASPANPHLHCYGLLYQPELEYVAGQAGDRYLSARAADHLACFRQMLARADGDFGARRGMATERYFNTRAFGPKGGILPVSHAWCLAALLWACTDAVTPYAAPASPAGAGGS